MDQQVEGRQVAVSETQPGERDQRGHKLTPQRHQARRIGPGLGKPWCGTAVRIPDELHKEFSAEYLDWVRNGQPGAAELAERGELSFCPLRGDHRAPSC